MTDRELLEAAAKAAGIGLEWFEVGVGDPDCDPGWYCDIKGTRRYWNPLTDDGDALRLAVKLGLAISIDAVERETWAHHDQVMLGSREWWPAHPTTEHSNEDMYAATRRAIVRAAAEIGKEVGL
jgi:hypothetical protein